MTRDEQRHRERSKLVWKMIVQAWNTYPHAFVRGSSKETLCHWIHEAARDINRDRIRTGRVAVWAPNLGPKEIRRVLMSATATGRVRVIKEEGRCTRFFIV